MVAKKIDGDLLRLAPALGSGVCGSGTGTTTFAPVASRCRIGLLPLVATQLLESTQAALTRLEDGKHKRKK